MIRSAPGPIVVTSLAVLFAVLTSPPPETVAVLVNDGGAAGATFTVRVIGEYLAPAVRASLRVHLRFWPAMLHTQPAPAAAVGVSSAGRVSLTVTGLVVGPPPMFDTVSTYCAPTWPCKKLPVCI